MQITVFIYNCRSVFKHKISCRSLSRFQHRTLCLAGLSHTDPLDVMGFKHRMRNTANRDMKFVTITCTGGNMLFSGCLRCLGWQQFHRFAAANKFTATVLNQTNQITTNLTSIKLSCQFHVAPPLVYDRVDRSSFGKASGKIRNSYDQERLFPPALT